jgi:hypothetical protein
MPRTRASKSEIRLKSKNHDGDQILVSWSRVQKAHFGVHMFLDQRFGWAETAKNGHSAENFFASAES